MSIRRQRRSVLRPGHCWRRWDELPPGVDFPAQIPRRLVQFLDLQPWQGVVTHVLGVLHLVDVAQWRHRLRYAFYYARIQLLRHWRHIFGRNGFGPNRCCFWLLQTLNPLFTLVYDGVQVHSGSGVLWRSVRLLDRGWYSGEIHR